MVIYSSSVVLDSSYIWRVSYVFINFFPDKQNPEDMKEVQYIEAVHNLSPADQQAYEEFAFRHLHRACQDLIKIYKNPRSFDHVGRETRFRVLARLQAPVVQAAFSLLQRAQPHLLSTATSIQEVLLAFKKCYLHSRSATFLPRSLPTPPVQLWGPNCLLMPIGGDPIAYWCQLGPLSWAEGGGGR